MELNKQKFALAAAGTMTIVYVVCTVFTALWPNFALQIMGWLIHIVNIENFAVAGVSFAGFFGGLIPIIFYSYIVGWLFAWIHNWAIKKPIG